MNQPTISMTPDVQKATDDLRAFLFEKVYLNPAAKSQEIKARGLVHQLFEYFNQHPERMKPFYYRMVQEGVDVRQCVCDFIAGMTDRYAIETYNELFVPRVWRGLHE